MEHIVRARGGFSIAAVAACAALCACGSATGERLSTREQRGLPLDEFGLQDLCPEKSDIRGDAATRLKRRREGQLAALEVAYHKHPHGVVRASYTPEDEPGMKHEWISLRQLASDNLDILKSLNCSPSAQRRLEALLQSS